MKNAIQKPLPHNSIFFSKPVALSFFASVLILVFSAPSLAEIYWWHGTDDFEPDGDVEYLPGQSYYGRNNYIEYIAGTVPIILTVPHGGSLTPSEIPDRTWGTMVSDTNTDELARTFCGEFYNETGRHPHIILCNLKRTKLDVNREISEAAQTNEWAEHAWREWHNCINTAKDLVIMQAGAGVYIDLHGHGHAIQRLEFGYSLSDSLLQLNDADIENYKDFSSIRTLAYTTNGSFAELLRGQNSFGGPMEARGFASVPSPQYPNAGGDPYFTGGYNTQQHGSQHGGRISGFQIECNYTGVRDTEANRIFTAQAMTESLIIYLSTHFGIDIDNLSMSALRVVSNNWLNDTYEQRLTGELIGHWSFDGATVEDSSGYGHHGRLVQGDPTTSINILYDDERESHVLELDNPSGHSVNSVVDCGGNASEGGWANISNAVTIAAWVKVDTYHVGHQYLITKGSSYQLTRSRATDGMRTYMHGLSSAVLTCSKNVNDGGWHHIAVTYDSNEAKRRIFIDGGEENCDRQSGPLIINSDSFVIGGRLSAAYDHRGWDGRIDEVRLYDYALRPDEIKLIYEGLSLPIPEPEPACYDIPNGDFNQDCLIDFLDFSAFASEWFNN